MLQIQHKSSEILIITALTRLLTSSCPAEIPKQKLIIRAQKDGERSGKNAKGEADAISAKMEAEGKKLYEILRRQAEGYAEVVKAAGGDPTKALKLIDRKIA